MADLPVNQQRQPYGNTRQEKVVIGDMKKIGKFDYPFTARLAKKHSQSDKITIQEYTMGYQRSTPQVSGAIWTQNSTYHTAVQKTFYHRIDHTSWSISDVVRDVKLYGVDEYMLQMEEKRNTHNAQRECVLLGSQLPLIITSYPNAAHQGSVIPTQATPGQTASFASLPTTHVWTGTGTGAVGGWRTASNTHSAPTAGTATPFVKNDVSVALRNLWKVNANTKGYVMLMNQSLREQANGFDGLFEHRTEQSPQSKGMPMIITAISGMRDTNGTVMFEIGRWMPPGCFYLIDYKHLCLSSMWMNDLKQYPKTGDSIGYLLRSNYALICMHEATQAVVMGRTGQVV